MLQEGGTNHIINNKAALFHISLPFGTTCEGQAVHNQPVLLDFGGTWDAYKTALGETGPVKTAFDLLLYHVDPLEVVKNHRQRGDLITMVVVIRDPRACLADKVLNHCKKPHVGHSVQNVRLRCFGTDLGMGFSSWDFFFRAQRSPTFNTKGKTHL